jgi:hypothetical protein
MIRRTAASSRPRSARAYPQPIDPAIAAAAPPALQA